MGPPAATSATRTASELSSPPEGGTGSLEEVFRADLREERPDLAADAVHDDALGAVGAHQHLVVDLLDEALDASPRLAAVAVFLPVHLLLLIMEDR